MCVRLCLLALALGCSQAPPSDRQPEPSTVQITDSSAVAVIGPEGGTIEFPGIGRVVFSDSTFTSPESVLVAITNFPSTPRGRNDYWLVGGGSRPDSLIFEGAFLRAVLASDSLEPLPVPYDVRVSASVLPAKSFEVVLNVPDSYLMTVPPSFTPQILAELESGGDLELLIDYHVIPSVYDPTTKTIRAHVWKPGHMWARQDGRFEVVLLIGSRPKE